MLSNSLLGFYLQLSRQQLPCITAALPPEVRSTAQSCDPTAEDNSDVSCRCCPRVWR